MKSIVNAVHASLRKKNDKQALETKEIGLSVRLQRMNSSAFEQAEQLPKLPKRNEHLNRAFFIEVSTRNMTFFKRCIKLAQQSGMLRKKFGPGVEVFFTGKYSDQETMSKTQIAQAMRAQRGVNYHTSVEEIEEIGDLDH